MHPILFRIPLPTRPLAFTWILLAVAALAVVWAVVVGRKNKEEAYLPGGIAVVAGVAAFFLRGKTWDMGPVPIYSYGVMLGLSLVVGWYLTLGLAERDGLPKETMANNYVITAIAAVAGSRILYILTNLNEFNSIADVFAMRRGGLVAYGGFLGGLAGSYFFLRRHKIPLLPWADVAVPSLASGLLITRIGCYLFGCDFGQPLKPTAPEFLKKLGTFPHWPEGTLDHGQGSPAWAQHLNAKLIDRTAEHSLPVHPTQIYESLVGAALLALLLVSRRNQKFRGQIFFLFAFAYGVARYMLEILRDDAERGSIPPALPEHILVPGGLAILSIGYLIGFSKAIENLTLRRVTQVIAFVPPVVLYFAMKPETFGAAATMQFSTSQFIAITSGFAASIAFAVFQKAAEAHPEHAMDLGLPAQFAPAGAPLPPAAAADDDEEEERRERPAKKVAAKKTAKKTAKKAAKKRPAAEDEVAEALAEAREHRVDEDGEGEGDKDGDGAAKKEKAGKEPQGEAAAEES